ncbi:MAG: hypothetical protein AAFO74_15375 [Pseudomonadota bacterium]
MQYQAFIIGAVLVIAAGQTAPVASAECDISDTKCALKGSKCNIRFRNKTAEAGGSDGGSSLDQESLASHLWVTARDDAGDRVGNKLSIGMTTGSKTMNLTKKANKENGFETIKMMVQEKGGPVDPAYMSCEEIKTVLNGNGQCKIFYGRKKGTTFKYGIGYQCDGGNVGGPK